MSTELERLNTVERILDLLDSGIRTVINTRTGRYETIGRVCITSSYKVLFAMKYYNGEANPDSSLFSLHEIKHQKSSFYENHVLYTTGERAIKDLIIMPYSGNDRRSNLSFIKEPIGLGALKVDRNRHIVNYTIFKGEREFGTISNVDKFKSVKSVIDTKIRTLENGDFIKGYHIDTEGNMYLVNGYEVVEMFNDFYKTLLEPGEEIELINTTICPNIRLAFTNEEHQSLEKSNTNNEYKIADIVQTTYFFEEGNVKKTPIRLMYKIKCKYGDEALN